MDTPDGMSSIDNTSVPSDPFLSRPPYSYEFMAGEYPHASGHAFDPRTNDLQSGTDQSD
jgi:hypothetical protein